MKVAREDGQWVARCRIRDLDGVARWGSTRAAAHQVLQDELARRRGSRDEMLRADSRFREAAALWSAKIAERREDSTASGARTPQRTPIGTG